MTEADAKAAQDRCARNAKSGKRRLLPGAPAVTNDSPPVPSDRNPSVPSLPTVFKSEEAQFFYEQAVAEGKMMPITTELEIAPTTDELKLNKTERARLQFLQSLRMPWLGVHCFTLKLGNDTRYTPDFCYVDPNGKMVMEEVKGFMRDDARVKLMTAARIYRMFKFVLVKKVKNGWDVTEVRP